MFNKKLIINLDELTPSFVTFIGLIFCLRNEERLYPLFRKLQDGYIKCLHFKHWRKVSGNVKQNFLTQYLVLSSLTLHRAFSFQVIYINSSRVKAWAWVGFFFYLLFRLDELKLCRKMAYSFTKSCLFEIERLKKNSLIWINGDKGVFWVGAVIYKIGFLRFGSSTRKELKKENRRLCHSDTSEAWTLRTRLNRNCQNW